jgi:hypothetical protein
LCNERKNPPPKGELYVSITPAELRKLGRENGLECFAKAADTVEEILSENAALKERAEKAEVSVLANDYFDAELLRLLEEKGVKVSHINLGIEELARQRDVAARAAVEKERERCAKIAEQIQHGRSFYGDIAEVIRSGVDDFGITKQVMDDVKKSNRNMNKQKPHGGECDCGACCAG